MTKKLKATLSMLLCAMMVLCSVAVGGMVVSAETVSGTCGDNLTWTFNSNTGELTISGTGEMENYMYSSQFPWNSYRSSITKLTIGDNVTSISRYAFEDCKALEEVIIPNKVETVGDCAFFYCEKLKKVTIGNSVTSIGSYAFSICKVLEEIVIPDNVEAVDNYAFLGCLKLQKATIGNSVTSIGNYAFSDCKALEEIVIPKSVKMVYRKAFDVCNNLKYVFYAGLQEDWSNIDIQDNNEKLTGTIIHYNATGHTFDTEGKCTVEGCGYVCDHTDNTNKFICTEDYICSVCKKKLSSATTHSFDANGKCTKAECGYVCDHTGNTNKATCTEPYTCSVCTKELSPATGHKFGEWKTTKSATFFKDGVETRTCVNEGCTETETRPVLSKFSEFKSGLFGVDFLKAILTVFADLLTSVC